MAIITFDRTIKTLVDPAGWFLHMSALGNEYTYIMYDWETNCILVEAMKNRQTKTVTDTWSTLHK